MNSDLGEWLLCKSVQFGTEHEDRCTHSTAIQVWIVSTDLLPREMFPFFAHAYKRCFKSGSVAILKASSPVGAFKKKLDLQQTQTQNGKGWPWPGTTW